MPFQTSLHAHRHRDEGKRITEEYNTYVLHADFHTNILSLILTEIRKRSGRIRSEPLIVYFDLSPKFNGFSLLCFPPLPFLPSLSYWYLQVFSVSFLKQENKTKQSYGL